MPVAPPCSGRVQRPWTCTSGSIPRRDLNSPPWPAVTATLVLSHHGWRYVPVDNRCQENTCWVACCLKTSSDTVGHVWTRHRCQGEISRGTFRFRCSHVSGL